MKAIFPLCNVKNGYLSRDVTDLFHISLWITCIKSALKSQYKNGREIETMKTKD